jgi:hypothetical protein
VAHVETLSSGTAAIHLGLVLLGVEGCEVLSEHDVLSICDNTIQQGTCFIDSEKRDLESLPSSIRGNNCGRITKGKKT